MRKLIRILVSSAAAGVTLIGVMQLGNKLGMLRSMAQENLCLGLGGLLILGLSIMVVMEKEQIVIN